MTSKKLYPIDIVFGLFCFCLILVCVNEWNVFSLYYIILALAGFYYHRIKRHNNSDLAEGGIAALLMAMVIVNAEQKLD